MRNKSVVWIPVLLVGAMVYWTLALGFGGLSLVRLTSEMPSPEGDDARDSYQSITVNLSESAEAEGSEQQAPDRGVLSDRGDRTDQGDRGERYENPLPDLDVPRVRPAEAGTEVGQGGLGLAGGTVRTGPGQTAF